MPDNHDGSPDSFRPSGLCPRCKKQSSFYCTDSLPLTYNGTVLAGFGNQPSTKIFTERATILICRHCEQGTLVLEEQWTGDRKSSEGVGGGLVTWRGFHWWPLPGTQVHNSVPVAIASVYTEGMDALAAKCPRAAAVMARRALEAIAVEKGETKGSLAARLNSLSNKGLLHPSLVDWTKEVRLIGNLGAHFDPIENVSFEDAQQLLSFIDELLKYLYVLPWELNQRRTKG